MASILIITPKDDEWRAACFELDANTTLIEHLRSGTILTRTAIAGRSLAIAALSRQTNTQSGVLTMELLYRENPRQVYLLGTALGAPNVPVGSVFVAETVQDISERRPTPENPNGWMVNGSRSPFAPELLAEVRDNIYENFGSQESRRQFFSDILAPPQLGQESHENARNEVLKNIPQIAVEPILSGNDYFMKEVETKKRGKVRDKVPLIPNTSPWTSFPGKKAYDMEAAGFSLAAEGQQTPWLVIRGVSDHGTTTSRLDRSYTTQAAARFLRQFLESDPSRIGRISSLRPRLAGSIAEALTGHYWGYMGYVDDDGSLVIYTESLTLRHIGERVQGNVNSILTRGDGVAQSLNYSIEIAVGAQKNRGRPKGNFAGVWSPNPQANGYFGSVSGLLDDRSESVRGLWTGSHKEGIRIGRFVWYNEKRMISQQDRDNELSRFIKGLSVESHDG